MFLENLNRFGLFRLGIVALLLAIPSLIPAQEDNQSTLHAEAGNETSVETLPNTNPTFRVFYPRNNQSPEQQQIDQLDCFESTCDQLDWDPYLAYDELVEQGFALALTAEEQKRGLVFLAIEGAMIGAVAGELVGRPGRGAEIGAAISLASAIIHSNYLTESQDPYAQRAISRYEKNLRRWDRTYGHCLKGKGYKVPSQ